MMFDKDLKRNIKAGYAEFLGNVCAVYSSKDFPEGEFAEQLKYAVTFTADKEIAEIQESQEIDAADKFIMTNILEAMKKRALQNIEASPQKFLKTIFWFLLDKETWDSADDD